jgi:hypothetical protein
MTATVERPRRWIPATLVLVILVLFLLVSFLLRGDERVRQATARLESGMTLAEMRAALAGVDFVQMPAKGGEDQFWFYGIDELVMVSVNREDGTVTKVEHEPDDGPWWERYRRRWHHRFDHLGR